MYASGERFLRERFDAVSGASAATWQTVTGVVEVARGRHGVAFEVTYDDGGNAVVLVTYADPVDADDFQEAARV